MLYNKKSRRQFLVGAGQVTLALPFLPSLWPQKLMAQSNPPSPKRFLAIWAVNGGQDAADLYPTYAADIPTALYGNHTIHHTNLRQSPGLGAISNIYTSGLNPYIPKLNLIEGLDAPIGFTHGENTFLGHYRFTRTGSTDYHTRTGRGDAPTTHFPDVPSIDQFLAYHNKFYSHTPIARSITISGQHLTAGRLGLIDPNNLQSGTKNLPSEKSALDVFNKLFGPATPPIAGGAAPAIPTAEQNNSSTLVDLVLSDLQSVSQSRKISAADKIKLDEFTNEMHELQRKLTALPPAVTAACTQPQAPTNGNSAKDYATDLDRNNYYDLLTSVIAAGIKCGRTQIATIRLSGAMIDTASGSGNLHSWGHAKNTTGCANAMRWALEKVYVPLLQKLDTPEASGKTFLDNSLIVFGNENSKIHKSWSRPILTAGSAGGFFKTGYYVDYRRRGVTSPFVRYATGFNPAHEMHPGILYNQFLVSALQSMGVSPADYQLPGVVGYSGVHLDKTPDGGHLDSNGVHVHEHCANNAGQLLPIVI